jgi:hypothetical protein
MGVLVGPDGIFQVDSQYAQIIDKVVAAIRKISSEPIRYLVNTHVHVDRRLRVRTPGLSPVTAPSSTKPTLFLIAI